MRILLIALAAASLWMSAGARAQSPQAEPVYREAQMRQGAYTTGQAPAWVTPAGVPETTLGGDAIRRLWETHFLAGPAPASIHAASFSSIVRRACRPSVRSS